ncbi:hypothetical protein [Tepidibacillus sp. HK-1]|uniref:hypothetical protein n=1 Tax=Tepidibacillus sp. HK-1 TaxID=1883407 RepID=UPI00085336EF|nr:hypothetical protein [Tepidibacillus sp. HK-1]GBF11478.1 hypothetical protein HK1_01509 [Tepidibacillus sp. HK-1]
MKKKLHIAVLAGLIAASGVLAGCSSTETSQKNIEPQQTNQTETQKEENKEVSVSTIYKEAVDELAKANEGQTVDYQKVIDLYTKELQPLVQKRDAEFNESADQQIMAALEAGKNNSMDGVVVKQIFDKLMQKNFFFTIRHEFTEVAENWDNKDKVKEEMKEAKEFYAILKSTVEKRDAAYQTQLVAKIDAGFAEMDKAIEAGDQLGFQLGKQVVDKTLMKTFYLATGALPNGYASKIAAQEDEKEAKAEQAEGWAFYQALNGYLVKNAKEEAEFIQSQFDLATDVKALDPNDINNAFVRGFATVALKEYEESQENWGKDKAVITALEGALFIDMIDTDLQRILGEEAYNTLNEQAQKHLEATKALNQEEAKNILTEIEKSLNTAIEKASK